MSLYRCIGLAPFLTACVLPAWGATIHQGGYETWYLDASVGYAGPGVALEPLDERRPDLGYTLGGSAGGIDDYLFGITLQDVPLGYDGEVEIHWSDGSITSSVGTASLAYSYIDGESLDHVDGAIRFGRDFELTAWDIALAGQCCGAFSYTHSSAPQSLGPLDQPPADEETAEAIDGLLYYVTGYREPASLFFGTQPSTWSVLGGRECFRRDPDLGFDDIVACPSAGDGPAAVPLPATAEALGLGLGLLALAQLARRLRRRDVTG